MIMMTAKYYSPLLLFSTVLLFSTTYSDGFQLPVTATARHLTSSTTTTQTTRTRTTATTTTTTSATTTTQLHNLFGNLFGQQSKQEGVGDSSNNNSDVADPNPVVDFIDIPAKVINIKPLKFYLQLFLVTQQNTPVKGSWLLNANEEVEEYLEVYYKDGTGVVLIQFDDLYGMRIKRKGKRPSLQYMLQESVLLHGLLDELNVIAFGQEGDDDEDVDDDKRLLQFTDENKDVLSKAREVLPARAAPKTE